MEVHDDPDNAASDGPNSVRLDQLDALLSDFKTVDDAAKRHSV
jgi:2-dehydro-3-deoxyphosphooctonate aldolase (KDO 8-P synthase)